MNLCKHVVLLKGICTVYSIVMFFSLRFGLSTVHIDGVRVQYPDDPSAFIKETSTAEFIECNHTQAHFFHTHYGLLKKDDRFHRFQRKARQLLSLARDALNSLSIPFWLSSGTCLGKWITFST